MMNFNHIDVENLLLKVELFYKRFYFNKLIKGIFISIGIILAFFIFIDLAFYYTFLHHYLRFFLVYFFILIFVATVYFWVISPLLKLLKLTKGISNEDAANFIGLHYAEIGDKLVNTLQYSLMANSSELANAEIHLKSVFFEAFDFTKAAPKINNNNKVFLFLVPLSLIVGIFLYNPSVIINGTERIVNYNVDYSSIAPYTFNVTPKSVKIEQGNDIVLSVDLIGNSLPNEIFIVINEVKYRCSLTDSNYQYVLRNLVLNSEYYFTDGRFSSETYVIQLIDNALLSEAKILVESPAYVGTDNVELTNPSLIEIAEGSKLFWEFTCVYSNGLQFFINHKKVDCKEIRSGVWVFSSIPKNDFEFNVKLINSLGNLRDVYNGDVVIVKDQFPKIDVSINGDNEQITFFAGSIRDDFGFHSLIARFSSTDSTWVEIIPISKRNVLDVFQFQVNHDVLKSTTSLTFEVRDNDVQNGYKKAVKSGFSIEVLSKNQLDSNLIKEGDDLINSVKELANKSNDLDKELKDLENDLLNKKNLDWNDQKKLDELVKAEEDFQKDLESLKEKLEKHHDKINKSTDPDSKILEKQKKLEELFNKLLDEKSKELYKELQDLLKKMNKDEIQKHLEKMKMNQEDVNKDLDRNLEIFKQMELEQGLEKSMEKLDKLSKKQLDLAKENKEKEVNNEENLKKQEEITEEFDELKEEFERLDSLNKDLKDPNELDLDKEKQEEISKDQKDAEKESKDGDQDESSKKQEDAGKKMEEMKEDMENSMSMNSSSQEGEDLDALRKLLENLLVLSFEQENIMEELKTLDKKDPLMVTVNQKQKELLQNSEMVKDSLYALSARIIQIESIITEETKLITSNMNNSIAELSERRVSKTLMYQQKSLTSINNLAVLLDEIIQQLQEQQKNKKKGEGSCSKPGEGKPKPSLKSSKKRQEELAKQIEKMKKQMEKGQTPGKMNPGKMGSGMSKEIAEMAAQQEMIRQEIRKMADELQKEGNMGGAGELKKLEQLLEQNEEDIINLELDKDFFARQQNIKVKMLEAQNAEQEREKEKRRESERAINYKKENNVYFDEYLRQKSIELELLRLRNPKMSGYYKSKVQEYNLEVD